MTPHVQNHEGWIGSGKISTLLAILSCMGTDCTADFNETHDSRGFKELAAFQVTLCQVHTPNVILMQKVHRPFIDVAMHALSQIGVLDKPNTRRAPVKYKTWEQLVASGCVSDCPGARCAASALLNQRSTDQSVAGVRPLQESSPAPEPDATPCDFCESSPCVDGCPEADKRRGHDLN